MVTGPGGEIKVGRPGSNRGGRGRPDLYGRAVELLFSNINLTPIVDDEDRLPFGQLSRCRPAPAPAVLRSSRVFRRDRDPMQAQIRVSKKIG